MNPPPAPAMKNLAGAFILDAGLLGTFWFAGMIFTTAIWVMGVYIDNVGTIPNSQPGPLASMLIGISALYLSILVLWAVRGRQLSVKTAPMTTGYSALMAISSGAALCLLMMMSSFLLKLLGYDLRPDNQALLEEAGKHIPLAVAIFTILIAPIFEELLFRKQIFARFHKAGYALSGYFLSSVLFAFMHEPLPRQGMARWILMLLLYSVMGAVFAWVYQKSGRLWAAILAHASNNILAVGVLLLA